MSYRTRAILHISTAAGLILAITAALPAQAQQIDVTTLINEGTDMVPACVSCHGAEGLGNVDIGSPMIAGLDAGYIAKALGAYGYGTKVGYTMNGIASELSADEIDALAKYYAALPVVRQDWTVDMALAEQVKIVAQNGVMEAGVPGCVSCHGQYGAGVGATFPRIAGQLPDYLTARIELWNTGEDTADTPEEAIMARISTATPPESMTAALAYFANLDPAAAPVTGYAVLDTDWPVQTYNTTPVLSDEFEPVSVYRRNREPMRNKAAATLRERRCVSA